MSASGGAGRPHPPRRVVPLAAHVALAPKTRSLAAPVSYASCSPPVGLAIRMRDVSALMPRCWRPAGRARALGGGVDQQWWPYPRSPSQLSSWPCRWCTKPDLRNGRVGERSPGRGPTIAVSGRLQHHDRPGGHSSPPRWCSLPRCGPAAASSSVLDGRPNARSQTFHDGHQARSPSSLAGRVVQRLLEWWRRRAGVCRARGAGWVLVSSRWRGSAGLGRSRRFAGGRHERVVCRTEFEPRLPCVAWLIGPLSPRRSPR